MTVDEKTGKLKRMIDPRALEDEEIDGYGFVEGEDLDLSAATNPFDSEDSDLDIDSLLSPIPEDGDGQATPFDSTAAVDVSGDTNELDNTGADKDAHAPDVESDADAAILLLVARQKERHKRNAESRAKNLQSIQEDQERLHALEVAKFDEARAKEGDPANAAPKDEKYEEAHAELRKNLRESFSF